MKRAKKPPPDLPDVGDWCCMRGAPAKRGVLLRYSWDTQWSNVAWAEERGPDIVHRYELRRMKQQPPRTSTEIPAIESAIHETRKLCIAGCAVQVGFAYQIAQRQWMQQVDDGRSDRLPPHV